MAIPIETLLDRLQQATADIEQGMEQIMLEIAIQLRTEVEERVTTTGINANGVSFSPYSQKQLPLSTFDGKVPNQGAFDRLVKTKINQGVFTASYAEIRKNQGAPTSMKTFQLTGEFWRSISEMITMLRPGDWEISWGPKSTYGRMILRENSEREGILITKHSEMELIAAQQIFKLWLIGILDKNNLPASFVTA